MKKANLKAADFTDLSSEILKGGNSIRFKARGSSMLPWIKDGDMLTIQPLTMDQIRPGHVVLYPSVRERLIVHRVLRVQSSGSQKILVTRGDASPKSEERIESEKILGRVTRIHRGSKVIQLDRNLWWRLVDKFPLFLHFTYSIVRFQRRLRRYVILSPKGSDQERGE